ncbi:hypothetical protein CEXT_415821 [Caerostris extrusa]|uniref:Uncharacterized protein n=1 Tax=Caerostris extrusa TaxID=172846 RepID=A0AAV4ME36_CAEEX|nr:hypothetical protein CEXT_415821 [Caerostris extrusa]
MRPFEILIGPISLCCKLTLSRLRTKSNFRLQCRLSKEKCLHIPEMISPFPIFKTKELRIALFVPGPINAQQRQSRWEAFKFCGCSCSCSCSSCFKAYLIPFRNSFYLWRVSNAAFVWC